ncbi:hypothetical protein [Streptomyces pilosus]|uniref:hypothetical protein n=1 Tax=Streptomyces pilosus TaxID=28893 RepID=UPI003638521C
MTRSTGPACGNNPNHRMTPGDRQAVDNFRAYLERRAAARELLDRAVWVDGDPLMEAIAAAVWEHCDTSGGHSIVTDDPRNIAAVAATVARAEPADRAAGPAALREAAAFFERTLEQSLDPDSDPRYCTAVRDVVMGLRRRADETATTEPGDALPSVVDLLNAELQHREGTLLPPPEGPEYTPCGCAHIEPEHRLDAGPCLVCECTAYRPVPAAAPAAVEPPADQTAILAATLREVLDTFSPMKDTHDGPVAYYDGSADIEPEQYDRWRAVLDGELRRMADETVTTETRPESCAHCGKPVRRITGTLATWWVHDPGGNTVCHPEQAASSPRATPKAAILHAVPLPGSNGISACCGRPPCEFVGERVTRDPDKVTCTEPAAGARQDEAQR